MDCTGCSSEAHKVHSLRLHDPAGGIEDVTTVLCDECAEFLLDNEWTEHCSSHSIADGTSSRCDYTTLQNRSAQPTD